MFVKCNIHISQLISCSNGMEISCSSLLHDTQLSNDMSLFHMCVCVAKNAMWCTSVLFTGTANSAFSNPCISIIKTHRQSSVSGQESRVWHTSVLFTGTANSLFSNRRFYITTGLLCVSGQESCVAHKCAGTIFKPSYPYNHYADIYQIHNFYALHTCDSTQLQALKEIGPVVCKLSIPENCPIFFTFSSYRFTKITFESTKDTLLTDQFLSNLEGTLWPILALKLEMFKLNLRELCTIISLKNTQNLQSYLQENH